MFTASKVKVSYDRAIQPEINGNSKAVFPKVQAESRKLDLLNTQLAKVLM